MNLFVPKHVTLVIRIDAVARLAGQREVLAFSHLGCRHFSPLWLYATAA